MEGSRCLDKGTVYQAEVTAPGKPKEKYVGIAATTWKDAAREPHLNWLDNHFKGTSAIA